MPRQKQEKFQISTHLQPFIASKKSSISGFQYQGQIGDAYRIRVYSAHESDPDPKIIFARVLDHPPPIKRHPDLGSNHGSREQH